MAINNGSPFKEKISITMPVEMLEILNNYCEYHGMCRSSAIAFLLAQGLCSESIRTNGFDFDSVFSIEVGEDGKEYIIKRSQVTNINENNYWVYSIGKNKQGKECIISSDDFKD